MPLVENRVIRMPFFGGSTPASEGEPSRMQKCQLHTKLVQTEFLTLQSYSTYKLGLIESFGNEWGEVNDV